MNNKNSCSAGVRERANKGFELLNENLGRILMFELVIFLSISLSVGATVEEGVTENPYVLKNMGLYSEEENILDKNIDFFEVKNGTMGDAVMELSYAGNIQYGFEYLSDETLMPNESGQKVTFSTTLENMNVRDALISWNNKHLANLRKMEKINGVNLSEGYTKPLELVNPMVVIFE
jgi:hypothetical protein